MPVKKAKPPRKTKIVEEITLNFRLMQAKPSDDEQNQQQSQPFYPSPPESDNEENKNDGDVDEEKKDEEVEKKDDEEMKEDDNNGAQEDADKEEKPKEKEEKVFDRWIKVPPKTRLKNIRKAILENLGVQDICTARVYSCTRPLKTDEDKKEASDKEDPEAENDDEKPPEDAQEVKPVAGEDNDGDEEGEYLELLIGEMASLESLGLREGSNLDVEVYFNLEVSVPGKGSSYSTKIEVMPDEYLGVLEQRVSFFSLFK